MIEELVKRVVTSVGIPESMAQTAIGLILGLFKDHGPEDKVSGLLDALPGATDLISKAQESSAESEGGGMMGGLMGAAGGLMGGGTGGLLQMVSQMQSAGLDTEQAKSVGNEVMNFAKEKAGDDVVDDIIGSIPGLKELM